MRNECAAMQPESTSSSAEGRNAFRLGTRAEFAVVLILSTMAALRVFIFSAAFPFFTSIDEQYHFDWVLKRARGNPTPLAPISAEAAEYIAVYESPEYYTGPQDFADGKMSPPIWILPRDAALARFKGFESLWQSRMNHESVNPPVYYFVAGLWWRIGEILGITGGYLLYWIRFLNILIAASLVWVGYVAARLVFPGQWFTRLAVAVLLAFFPQDIFYSIESDVLSPLLFGVAFIGLIKIWSEDVPRPRLAIFTGLAMAATVLVKATNGPLLVVSGLVILCKMWRLSQAGKFSPALSAFALLGVCALVPVGIWMAWNLHHLGSLMGTEPKFRFMHWTHKPLSQWYPHPLFTLRGQKDFLSELLSCFWRGEFRWDRKELATPLTDAFYSISSATLIIANLPALLRRGSGLASRQRAVLWISLSCFAAAIALQSVSSIAFDFGDCEFPSRAHPLFTNGRLMSWALIPFFLLYARGLEKVLGWRGNPWPPLAGLMTIVVIITVSQIQLSWPAFSSLYNFFHLVPVKTATANLPSLYLFP